MTCSLQCSVLAVKVPDAQFFQAKPRAQVSSVTPTPLQTPLLLPEWIPLQNYLNLGLCEPVLPKFKTAALSLPFPPQELSPVGEG